MQPARTSSHRRAITIGIVLLATTTLTAAEDEAAVAAELVEVEAESQLDAGAVGDAVPSVSDDEVPSLRIDLGAALGMAFMQGRDKRTRDEDLALIAHRLRVVRRDYGPRLSGSVDGSLFGDEGEAPDNTAGVEVGVSQTLPTAGTVGAEVSTRRNGFDDDDTDTVYNQRVELTLTQPLLRDAGALVWREDLTDAEREFLYAGRGYRQFLQDLSLGVAGSFWRLQEQRFRVESSRQEVARSEFGLAQSRAFLDLGRTTANDVFRAEVALLQSRQSLVDAIAAFDTALDRFKIDLNLPVDAPVEIIGEAPSMPLIDIDSRQAIALAIEQRYDLRTVRDRIADAERRLKLARNRILPDLDLTASAGWGDPTDRPWEEVFDRDPDYAVGLRLEIPFERHQERFGYASQLTRLSQAKRDADLQESQVVRQVQAALRDLRKAEVSLQIQQRNVEQSRKRLIKSQMDYEAGLISNRDLVEAQSEVREAEVATFSARIAYRQAELQLRRDTGVLTVDERGMWSEDLPPYAEVRAVDPEGGADDAQD